MVRASAGLAVGDALTLVPVARMRGCDAGTGLCETLDPELETHVIQPTLETREIPPHNTQPGFERP